MATDLIPTHPVQALAPPCAVPQVVSTRAYEVYENLFGAQQAIVTGDCRGGFSLGEMIAFLYARSFPKEEWRKRFDEALAGMRYKR